MPTTPKKEASAEEAGIIPSHGISLDIPGVEEFSKSRLRKRAQSNILRRPHGIRRPGHLAAGMGFNSPLHRHSASDIHDGEEAGNPLYLIKEEIAIMKKLNHPNLVSLIEVLDDPNEDSLYMVLEMCEKGVIMKVGVNERADPYDPEDCRCWFRDLILGIEYLHAQGVVHRDIKPDNCLLTADDELKIVDFGVSEMFEKQSEMKTAKSAGSPAFLPPELCVSKHGDISGKAVDIWSMGVTLYCLYFGRIPFEKAGVLDLYESIKNDGLEIGGECEEDFKDLMHRILEKDPDKRITMTELRDHPWVTRRGEDPLLSAEENTAELVEPPTEEEMSQAITGNLSNLIVVMRAVKKFKGLLTRRRPYLMDSILGRDTRMVQPPLSMDSSEGRPGGRPKHLTTRSFDAHNRRPIEQTLVAEGVHRKLDTDVVKIPSERNDSAAVSGPPKRKTGSFDQKDNEGQSNPKQVIDTHHGARRSSRVPRPQGSENHKDMGKGHAHNPLEEYINLEVGPKGEDDPPDPPAVSESPPAADIDIYETAYHKEVERIRADQGKEARLYLTRRVDDKKEYQDDENMVGLDSDVADAAPPPSGLAKVLHKVKEKSRPVDGADGEAE
ncbi:MAG: hypothetical protein Q9187_003586 [Circinaria calcarea]